MAQNRSEGKEKSKPAPLKTEGCGTQIRLSVSMVRHPRLIRTEGTILCSTRLAFIDDLNIVAVWIENPGGIIARIVFGTGLRWLLTLSSSC
jgi:hypothetical protein